MVARMSDTRRQPLTIRLSENGRRAVRDLALQETEGNESMMVRRLLAEALRARGYGSTASQPR